MAKPETDYFVKVSEHEQRWTTLLWLIPPKNIIPCPQCKEPKLPHRICMSCGFYDNKLAVPIKKKKKKKEKNK